MFVVLVSTFFFAMLISAENHEPQPPAIESAITNNGPVEEGSTINFTASCIGNQTKLVICRENTICNGQTQVPDLLCSSALAGEAAKQCSYATTALDKGVHANDVATCCDENNKCGTTVMQVSPWSVTQAQQQQPTITIVDEASNPIPATVTKQDTITRLTFENQPINKIALTNLQGATLGFSKISRGIIPPENITFGKVYGLDLEDIFFDEATLTATASASLLYRCKFWDFSLSTCLGSWEFVKPVAAGQEYTFNLMKGSFGFAEASVTQLVPEQTPLPPVQPPPENIEEQMQPPIEQPKEEPRPEENITRGEPRPIEPVEPDIKREIPITNNGPVEEGENIVFAGACGGNNTKLVICQENSICNTQTKKEDLLCESAETDDAEKTCAYKTEVKDLGEHTNDIATCCNADNACASTTALIEPWTVKEKVIAEINRTLPEEKKVTPVEEVNITPPENISLPPPDQQPIAAPEIPGEKPWIIWNYTQEEAASLKNNGRLFNELFKHIRIEDKDEAQPANASIKIETEVVIDNATEGVIVSKYDYLHGKHYEVKIGSEGHILFDVGDPDMSVTLETTNSYRDGQTHVIVASLDKGLASLVVDGKEEARVNAVIQDMESDVAVSIGANIGFVPWMGITLNEFKGVIKDVKVTYK